MDTRPALRRLDQHETPQPGEDPHSRKRPRMGVGMQTPAATAHGAPGQVDTPMLLSTASKDRPSGYNSELLEYLKGRGGRIKELEDELARARQRSDAFQAEVQASQEQLLQLKQQLSVARASASQKEQLTGQLELAELERLLEEEIRKGVDLEGQLLAAQEGRQAAEQAASQAAAAARAAQAEQAQQASALQLQVQAVQRQLKVLQNECNDRVRQLELELKVEHAKRDAEQEVHRAVLKQLEERRAKDALLAKGPAVASGPSDSHTSAKATTVSTQIRQLEEQLRLKDVELQRLALQMSNAAARGSLVPHSSEAAAQPATKLLPSDQGMATAGLVSELAAVQRQLRGWQQGPLQRVLASISLNSGTTADEVAATLKQLAQQATELRECIAAKDAELLQLLSRASEAEQRCSTLQTAAAAARADLQAATTAGKAASRQLAVITQERDALRRALAVPASTASPNTVSRQVEVQQQVMRCEELQALVSTLQGQLATLQGVVDAAAVTQATQRVEAQEARQQADAAQARCVQLEKEADSLALCLASLQTKLGQGEVNRSSVRVLHFKLNPEAQYQREKADSTVSELKAENEALKRKLEDLATEVEAARRAAGAAGGKAVEAGPTMSGGQLRELAAREAEVAVIRHRLSEMEKSMVRLKEVTKERIVAFREACYCMFGYRVDMTSEATAAKDAANAPTTFSLKPQHADDPNLMLVFRYTKARGMELVPNAYSAKMAREVDTFIHKFKCIPAFTANLTVENFQKQTQC